MGVIHLFNDIAELFAGVKLFLPTSTFIFFQARVVRFV